MVLPLIPLVCLAALFGGVGGLYWYESLSKGDKEKADAYAAELAWKLYQKSLKNLTRDQLDHVAELVRQRFLS